MILSDIAIVLADTFRSKAYLQALINHSLIPSKCFLLIDSLEDIKQSENKKSEKGKFFDTEESIYYTIKKHKLPFIVLGTKDINSYQAMQILQDTNETYLIYSGYGGCILKQKLFCMKKKWIHIHAGILPEYRGSTTAYYSLLKDNMIGATAIFMNEYIDQGQIIAKQQFPAPPINVNIDYIYEPYIRSKLLIKILEQYIREGRFSSVRQNNFKAETYYIIHPVLKHIAILSLEHNKNYEK